MRIKRALAVLSMGLLFFLVACGGQSGEAPPTKTPAANPSPEMDMTPTPAQTKAGANFTTSNLVVTPDKAKPGERVMVGVTVTNTGTQQGTYTVLVKDHDGKMLGTKAVTLAGGAKEDVSLHISINTTGTHMVMIDKLYHNLMIQQDMTANMTPMQPAQPPQAMGTGFAVSVLNVEPDMPDVGENITVTFMVTNNGATQGTYHAEVKIDGTVVATKDVTLAAGANQAINIPMKGPLKEGTFTITVGDQSIKMTVMAM